MSQCFRSCAEPRCGPVSGGAAIHSGVDQEPPQPLVVRSPSVSLIKWPSTPVRSPSPTGYQMPKPRSQPPENNNNNNNTSSGGGSCLTTGAQPVSLTALDRDCFIIPVHSVDRFLPAGVPLPVSFVSNKTVT